MEAAVGVGAARLAVGSELHSVLDITRCRLMSRSKTST